ncbi:MAG: hypothetical protein HW420_580 [Candidatus Nitrosotenuis sp.]|nr:hypothetical protein [Candidatus Nitrosotenuis sp.]
MATRAQVLIPIGIAAIIIGAAGIISIPNDAKLEQTQFPRGIVKIDDIPLQVQIADTRPLQIRGLMFQEKLPYDQGMLFVFDDGAIRSMWMLNRMLNPVNRQSRPLPARLQLEIRQNMFSK